MEAEKGRVVKMRWDREMELDRAVGYGGGDHPEGSPKFLSYNEAVDGLATNRNSTFLLVKSYAARENNRLVIPERNRFKSLKSCFLDSTCNTCCTFLALLTKLGQL